MLVDKLYSKYNGHVAPVYAHAQIKSPNILFLLSKFYFAEQPLLKSRKFYTAHLLKWQNFGDNLAVQTVGKHESDNFIANILTIIYTYIYTSLHTHKKIFGGIETKFIFFRTKLCGISANIIMLSVYKNN